MECQVLLFAQLADELGTRRMLLDVPEGSTVGEVIDLIQQAYPQIASHRRSLAFAMNEAYCPDSARVTEGATIALIPPVSGG